MKKIPENYCFYVLPVLQLVQEGRRYKKLEVTSMRLDKEVQKDLKVLAAIEGLTQNEMIRKLIQHYKKENAK
jgi:predicted DNA-binding protein